MATFRNWRGFLVAGLVVGLSIPTLSAWAAGRFIDDNGNVHEADIEAIAEAGITKGCNPPTNNRYCPSDPVTRGQMAAFLRRAFGLKATSSDFFSDDGTSVFEADINALASAGITKGCNPPANTKFCPDDPVTRGQMAAFLRRAFSYPNSATDFFSDDNGSVFEADINAIAAQGVTKGCNPPTNTNYCPDDLVRRDQMASFLTRALGLTPKPPCGNYSTATTIWVSLHGDDAAPGTCANPVRTIQRGVTLAPVGGTVAVAGGSYRETVEIAKSVTIDGTGPATTIIDGTGADDRLVSIPLGVSATITDLSVRNGGLGGIENRGSLIGNNLAIVNNGGGGADSGGGGIFNHDGANLTLTNAVLESNRTGSSVISSFAGGAIDNRGVVRLFDVQLVNNLARGGGGIYNEGEVFAENLELSGNDAQNGGAVWSLGLEASITIHGGEVTDNSATNGGGGIHNSDGSTVELIEVTVAGNTTGGLAGGIWNEEKHASGATIFEGGVLILDRVTVSGNSAVSVAGGIYAGGEANITNSTITDNLTANRGGGVYSPGGLLFTSTPGVANLLNVTVSHNSAAIEGGGLFADSSSGGLDPATITLKNTIVAASISGLDCAVGDDDLSVGAIVSSGHNVDGDGSCGLGQSGDISNVNPKLGSLADNGGPTQTRRLLSDSPAIDAASTAAGPAVDQRSTPRPQGPSSDIGAYEVVK